jgi:DNA processing protein
MPKRPTQPRAADAQSSSHAFAPEQLLGPLNPLEQRHAPKQLFVAGHSEWLKEHPRVAIVGSRRASPEGLKRAARLARLLTEHEALVVSGLAEGIDWSAHTATMQAGGRTIAVVGTSLQTVYPSTHRDLQERLMREQLVVSQFPAGSPTTRRNFPMRNRTMALLCDASVIVEAGDGSGSLSQGWEALRLGRPLFLMASILERKDLSWPRTMLDYGAMILKNPAELLSRLPARIDDPLSAIA